MQMLLRVTGLLALATLAVGINSLISAGPPSEANSASLAGFFHAHHALAPICCGLLLGLAIGGLVKRRAGLVGLIVAGIVLVAMVGFLAYLITVALDGQDQHHQNNYEGLALFFLVWLALAGYALLVAALYVGIGLMAGLRKLAQLADFPA